MREGSSGAGGRLQQTLEVLPNSASGAAPFWRSTRTTGSTCSLSPQHTADPGAMLQVSKSRHLLPAGLLVMFTVYWLSEPLDAACQLRQHESK